MTVGKPIAVSKPADNRNYFIGFPVTVKATGGTPLFDGSHLGLEPDKYGNPADDGQFSNDALGKRINGPVCGKLPMLRPALRAAGGHVTPYDGIKLPLTGISVTGCVTFAFDRPAVPRFVGYYQDEPDGSNADELIAAWTIKLPTNVIRPPKPAVTLRITGNGSKALVTYTEGSSIEQDTDASLPWSKSIDDGYSFYEVSAQDDDGTSITCEILDADGSVLDKHTSSGAYAIASCTSSR